MKRYQMLLAGLLSMAALPGMAAPACDTVAGTAPFLQGHRILMVGENHGSQEMPAMFARLVRAALRSGQVVSVGLELPASEQQALAAFMASDGADAARKALISGTFWSKGRDGRQSAAMRALIASLRDLRQQGLPLTVFALEARPAAGQPTLPGRDANMAEQVRAAFTARPDVLVMTLTGNIHNMLRLPSSMDRLPTPMGALLADLHPASIDLRASGGTMWNCSPDCGVHEQSVFPRAPTPLHTFIADGEDGIYTGAIYIGATTAALPATAAVTQ